MLDKSRPGDAAAETTALKRERSGSRKIRTLPELTALRERRLPGLEEMRESALVSLCCYCSLGLDSVHIRQIG